MRSVKPSRAPGLLLLALEWRSLVELGVSLGTLRQLRRAPRGDGHPVLVIPGFGADDHSTLPLRWFLRDCGYRAHAWRLGVNLGPHDGVAEALQQRLQQLQRRHTRKVSVVGWSLGGVYARELARNNPDAVRCVVTMGSPFGGAAESSNAGIVYRMVNRGRVGMHPWAQQRHLPVPVPTTAIYSRSDGVVSWEHCQETPGALAENVEVCSSHTGLGWHPGALWTVADRLSQPEGKWRHFRRENAPRSCFPRLRRRDAQPG